MLNQAPILTPITDNALHALCLLAARPSRTLKL
jgi:hypothetical protein